MRRYSLKPNRRTNTLDIGVFDGKSSFSITIMKVNLVRFIEEAEKFLKGEQDDIFIQGHQYYSSHGEAIEIKRDFMKEEIENDLLYLFVYCGASSGYCNISYTDLQKFVDNAKIEIKSTAKWVIE